MDSAIDEKTYLNGSSLDRAIFDFGNPELINTLTKTNSGTFLPNISPNKSFAKNLIEIVGVYNNFQLSNGQSAEIIAKLRKQFLNNIEIGELSGFGYVSPRNLKDIPVKIPADIFLSGEILWDKSELKLKNIEFTGIRIIKNAKLSANEPEKEI